MTRTEKTMKNVRLALVCQVITLITNFITRRLIVSFLAPEYLSVGGLFSNIMTVLSLAELGVGASITFSLYKPLNEGDEGKLAALMKLFRRAYTAIGTVVLALGVALLPLLRFFVDDFDAAIAAVPDFYVIYILYVVNAGASYFLAYSRTLVIADQKKYVTSVYSSLSQAALCIAACFVLWLTKNYVVFMAITVGVTLAENVGLYLFAKKTYPYLNNKNAEKLTTDDRSTIKANVTASMMHNIGGVLVNGTDNIIISRFVGFLTEGIYSAYHLIAAAVDSMLRPIFQSTTASYGDLSVVAESERRREVFERMFFAGAWLYGFSAVAIAVLSAPFVALWLGDGFEIDEPSVMLVALNFYLVGMRRPGMSAREAMGLLRYDKWKSIAEAAINIVLSIILAKYLGLFGVLLGTTVSSMLTCFWVEPIVLYRRGFGTGVGRFFARYGIYTAVTGAAFAATYFICRTIILGGIGGFLVKAAACLTVPNVIYLAAYFKIDEFKYFNVLIKSKIKRSSNKNASEK